MKHTQDEIINALKVIQDTCKSQGIELCRYCPLSKNGGCVLQEQAPIDWKINPSPPLWKAFK